MDIRDQGEVDLTSSIICGELLIPHFQIKGCLDLRKYPHVKHCICYDNKLTSIICNENLSCLNCTHNYITFISFTNPLETLWISESRLQYKQVRKALFLYGPKLWRDTMKRWYADRFITYYEDFPVPQQCLRKVQRNYIRYVWR